MDVNESLAARNISKNDNPLNLFLNNGSNNKMGSSLNDLNLLYQSTMQSVIPNAIPDAISNAISNSISNAAPNEIPYAFPNANPNLIPNILPIVMPTIMSKMVSTSNKNNLDLNAGLKGLNKILNLSKSKYESRPKRIKQKFDLNGALDLTMKSTRN